MSCKAFAPANISCIFKIYEHEDLSQMGSYGVGFTLNEGVTVEASKAPKREIFLNGKKIIFPTVMDVIKMLTREGIHIYITSSLPLGYGFGLSGACALAAAYAINMLLGLNMQKLELARIAHISEVKNKTGLGDVVNQYFGGFFLKARPSSEFIVERIPITNIPVYCSYFTTLSTERVLSNPKTKDTVNVAADIALEKVKQVLKKSNKKNMFGDIISLSKEFAKKSNLFKSSRVTQIIKRIEKKGGHASMIMLGNAVFSDMPFDGSTEFIISDNPARVL